MVRKKEQRQKGREKTTLEIIGNTMHPKKVGPIYKQIAFNQLAFSESKSNPFFLKNTVSFRSIIKVDFE